MEEKKTYEELEKLIQELKEQMKSKESREYKSRLFSFIFGREENKLWTLSLYNAIHGTAYDDPSGIVINTIEDVVYMGMKNDLSILVSESVSLYRSIELYEQQSSYNPNMPVREFMYAGKLYDKFIHSSGLNLYGKKLLPLPLPKLVTFYNGEDEKEDEAVLSLSDAFKEEIRQGLTRGREEGGEGLSDAKAAAMAERILRESSPDIDVRVRMININHGHNRALLSACRPLGEYAWFVARVRKNLSARVDGVPCRIGDAIDKAIDEMPEDFVIKKFITANRAEVKDMCLTEYNEAKTMEMLKEEGRQEGLQKGLQEGRQKGLMEGKHETRLLDIINLMDCMGWTAERAMDALKIPRNQRAALFAGLSEFL